jgi:hypothetical protein
MHGQKTLAWRCVKVWVETFLEWSSDRVTIKYDGNHQASPRGNSVAENANNSEVVSIKRKRKKKGEVIVCRPTWTCCLSVGPRGPAEMCPGNGSAQYECWRHFAACLASQLKAHHHHYISFVLIFSCCSNDLNTYGVACNAMLDQWELYILLVEH